MNFPHHVTLIMFRSKGKVAWWEGLWLNAVSSQQKKLFSYWNTFLPIHKLWCLYCGTKAKFHNLHLEELIIVSCNSKFSSVQSLNHGWLFATPWTAARQASLSITNSRSLLKLMSIELVMPFNHLILYRPLLFLPSIFPSIRVFSNESVLLIRWRKYWSFSISPSNENSGLISFRIDQFDLFPVQGTIKSLLQHHSSTKTVIIKYFSEILN